MLHLPSGVAEAAASAGLIQDLPAGLFAPAGDLVWGALIQLDGIGSRGPLTSHIGS
jgi:hypothetical protein